MTTKGAYSHILSGALSQYVEGQLSKPAENQNEVQEELALLRANASQQVELFNRAVEKGDPQGIFVAGQMMKKELQAVANMASTAANIQSKSTEQITRAGMEAIVAGMIDIIFEVLRPEPNGMQIAAAIEKRIQGQMQLTLDRGTVSLPSDELVKLMDGSVGVDKNTVDANFSET